MKIISFNEFAQLCNDKRVICEKTGLRADFNSALEKTLGEFATKTIYVGNENDQEGYDITEHIYDFICIGEDGNVTAGFNACAEKIKYSISDW